MSLTPTGLRLFVASPAANGSTTVGNGWIYARNSTVTNGTRHTKYEFLMVRLRALPQERGRDTQRQR
eukprot:2282-Eustigmatos_ZCMA.PRE.1